jgi:hypothetical protein
MCESRDVMMCAVNQQYLKMDRGGDNVYDGRQPYDSIEDGPLDQSGWWTVWTRPGHWDMLICMEATSVQSTQSPTREDGREEK